MSGKLHYVPTLTYRHQNCLYKTHPGLKQWIHKSTALSFQACVKNHSIVAGTWSVHIWYLHHSQFSCHFHMSFSLLVCSECAQISPLSLCSCFTLLKKRPDAPQRNMSPCKTPNITIQTLTVLATDKQVASPYQMSLVLEPRARSPSVEKKSSISFSKSRLRFSASSRALSEFRSLISSMRCFFLSCSISCSKRSICAQRAALDSSSLTGGSTDRGQKVSYIHPSFLGPSLSYRKAYCNLHLWFYFEGQSQQKTFIVVGLVWFRDIWI